MRHFRPHRTLLLGQSNMLLTKIDRYLLTLYFRILLICFSSIAGLLIVIHIFGNLDDLSRSGASNQTSIWKVLLSYYLPFAISVFERVSALLALLALLFTIGWLNRTNELTALLAAGVAKRRIILPLLVASMCVILTAAAVRETVIPLYQDLLDRKPGELVGEAPRPVRPTYDPHLFALIQGRHLIASRQEIVDPNLRIQGGPILSSLGPKVIAKQAVFHAANDQHPAGFLLTNIVIPRNIDAKSSAVDPESGQVIMMSCKDYDWLPEQSCFFVTNIDYESLRGGNSWQHYASTLEIITRLKAERGTKSGNDLRVSIHQRLIRPAIDWTVLLLGIPVLLARPDRHMFWVAGVSLAIVGSFTAVVMGLAAAGSSGYLISPLLATWLPLVVFLPWAWAKTAQAMET